MNRQGGKYKSMLESIDKKDFIFALVVTLSLFLIVFQFALGSAEDRNEKPEPEARGVAIGSVSGRVSFHGFSSSDDRDETSELDARWDFDSNGNWEIEYSDGKTAKDRVFHKYDESGEYTVTLEVRDTKGATHQDTFEVTIMECEELKNKYSSVINKYDGEGGSEDGKITIDELLKAIDDFIETGSPGFEELCALSASVNCDRVECEDHMDCEEGKICNDRNKCIKPDKNMKPVANASGMKISVFGHRVSLHGMLSHDPEDKDELDARWDFDSDGIWEIDYSAGKTNKDRVFHKYFEEGTHEATLEVRDSKGATAQDSIEIELMYCTEMYNEYTDIINEYDGKGGSEDGDISIDEFLKAIDDFIETGSPGFEKLCVLASYSGQCKGAGCEDYCKSKGFAGAKSDVCGLIWECDAHPKAADEGAPCSGGQKVCCCTDS